MMILRILIGALLGAGAGALFARSKVCGHAACTVRNRRIPNILAGAVAGALIASRAG